MKIKIWQIDDTRGMYFVIESTGYEISWSTLNMVEFKYVNINLQQDIIL